jgi:hypothetical protein
VAESLLSAQNVLAENPRSGNAPTVRSPANELGTFHDCCY